MSNVVDSDVQNLKRQTLYKLEDQTAFIFVIEISKGDIVNGMQEYVVEYAHCDLDSPGGVVVGDWLENKDTYRENEAITGDIYYEVVEHNFVEYTVATSHFVYTGFATPGSSVFSVPQEYERKAATPFSRLVWRTLGKHKSLTTIASNEPLLPGDEPYKF